MKYYILAVSLIIANLCIAQNDIKVKFIGNCGLYLTDGSTHIYTDFPYKSGAYGYMKYNQIEIDSVKNNAIFIFTHQHADHYSGKVVHKLLKGKNCKKFTQWDKKKLLKYLKKKSNIDIKVFKTKHRFAIKHHSYLITWNGKRIFFSGDTESAETISNVKNIDWAFVPPWLLDDAKEKNLKIDAKNIGVYHLYPSEIKSAIKEWGHLENITPMVNQGEIIQLD